jgi:hypothetical protein
VFEVLNELLTNFVPVCGFFQVLFLEELQVDEVVLLVNKLSESFEAQNDAGDE